MSDVEKDAAEADRVSAELGRVEAEEERVDAEAGDGGSALELGRVQAETGRVEAEEKRHEAFQTVYRRVALLIALPIALVALIPSMIGLVWLSHEIDNRCVDTQVNRALIRETVLSSFEPLGYTYDEKTGEAVETGQPIDYYVDHPKERAKQLEASLNTIERFPAIHCDRALSL